MMKHPSKTKGGNNPVRREHNRVAQHAFRQRRKAAELAQQKRVQQLEDALEEMSNMFISLCDEVMGADELAQHHHQLVSIMQTSLARALTLAKSVSASESGDEKAAPTLPRIETTKRPEIEMPNLNSITSTSTSPQPQHSLSIESSGVDILSMPPKEGQAYEFPLAYVPYLSPPVSLHAWPDFNYPQLDATSFAPRLVELTLRRACRYLGGEIPAKAEDLDRAFTPASSPYYRDELLAYFRWLLGPGRLDMLRETSMHRDTNRADYITALAVQQQLQSLGARNVTPDILKLQIKGGQSIDLGTTRTGTTQGLLIQLSTPTLISNLASSAICLDTKPAYPRSQVQRAIEASLIFAEGF